MRGHIVTLFEETDRIGGQTNLMASLPGRSDTLRAINFWKSEIDRLNIKLVLNHRVTSDEIRKIPPDIVVCATGVKHGNTVFSPAFDSPPVGAQFLKSLTDILSMNKVTASDKHSVIYDDRGDFQALGWAELLAEAGIHVTLITRYALVAPYVEPWTRLTACKRLIPKGVSFVADSCVREIKPHSAVYFNLFSKIETEVSSDATYFVSWPLPENTLGNELKSQEIKSYAIGDCQAPRSIEEAVYEGHELARRL
jgi:hypothetical protein